MILNLIIASAMIEMLFNRLFDHQERERIRSRTRSEPTETARKAWILFAYMNDFSIYDIAWCTSKNIRQVRYLLNKAEDLFSINDKELHRYIEKYERTLAQPCGADSATDR